MARDQQESAQATARATRCQLLWAFVFLVGVSLAGWLLMAKLFT